MLVWHVDEREDAGVDSSNGITLAGNWTFNDRWMPYARIGFSWGSAPIYNDRATFGLIRKFMYRSDVVGISATWGSPPGKTLKNQKTMEAFWRFQFSKGLAFTPSIQYLVDPALHPTKDKVWILGFRTRLAM